MILPGPSHDAQRDGSLEEQTAWKGDGAPQLPMVRGVIRRASTTEDEAVIAKVRESLRTDMRRGFLIPVEVAEQLGLPIGGAWVLSGPAQQGSVDVCVCVCVQCPVAASLRPISHTATLLCDLEPLRALPSGGATTPHSELRRRCISDPPSQAMIPAHMHT